MNNDNAPENLIPLTYRFHWEIETITTVTIIF